MAPPRATAWPESIYHDTDVLSLDVHGQFILCRVCAEHYAAHGGKKPKRVRMNARFRTRAWETHKRRTRAHNPAGGLSSSPANETLESESEGPQREDRRRLRPSAVSPPTGATLRSQTRPQIERTQAFIYPDTARRTSIQAHEAASRAARMEDWSFASAALQGSHEPLASSAALQTTRLEYANRPSGAVSREHETPTLAPEAAPLSIRSLLNPAPPWDDMDCDPHG